MVRPRELLFERDHCTGATIEVFYFDRATVGAALVGSGGLASKACTSQTGESSPAGTQRIGTRCLPTAI
jgi:hypothetical protein